MLGGLACRLLCCLVPGKLQALTDLWLRPVNSAKLATLLRISGAALWPGQNKGRAAAADYRHTLHVSQKQWVSFVSHIISVNWSFTPASDACAATAAASLLPRRCAAVTGAIRTAARSLCCPCWFNWGIEFIIRVEWDCNPTARRQVASQRGRPLLPL